MQEQSCAGKFHWSCPQSCVLRGSCRNVTPVVYAENNPTCHNSHSTSPLRLVCEYVNWVVIIKAIRTQLNTQLQLHKLLHYNPGTRQTWV